MSDSEPESDPITFQHYHTRGDGNCLFQSILIAFGQPSTLQFIQMLRHVVALRIYDLKREVLDEMWADNDPCYKSQIGDFTDLTHFEKAKLIARYYAQMNTYGDENIVKIIASMESIIIRVYSTDMELIGNFKPGDIFENTTLRAPKKCILLRFAFAGTNSECNHYSVYRLREGGKQHPFMMTLSDWRKIEWTC